MDYHDIFTIYCMCLYMQVFTIIMSYHAFCFFSEEEYFFEVAEAVFVGWFTFEYVIRFVAAPQKLK